jgi:hypothetical protein
VDFPDEASAMTARNFYAGWKLPGQTGAGISLEVRDATRASDALFALIEFISWLTLTDAADADVVGRGRRARPPSPLRRAIPSRSVD